MTRKATAVKSSKAGRARGQAAPGSSSNGAGRKAARVRELFKNRIVKYTEETPASLAKRFNPQNYREHPLLQSEATRSVLIEIGWIQTVIVNVTTGNMIDGHLRVTLALDNREKRVPVTWVRLSAEEELAALATLDPLTGLAKINAKKHQMILERAKEIMSRPQTLDLLTRLRKQALEQVAKAKSAGQKGRIKNAEELDAEAAALVDKAAELQRRWKTASGQLWTVASLNNAAATHKIAVIDSINPEHVAALFGGEVAAAAIFDPPYNVGESYGERPKDRRAAEDKPSAQDEYRDFCAAWFGLTRDVSRCQVFTPSTGKELVNIPMWFEICWPLWICQWFKRNTTVHSPLRGFQAWEPILVYGKIAKPVGQDFFDVPQVRQRLNGNELTEYHPTPKPLQLFVELVDAFSEIHDTVYDPFAGSGTTLLAAELNARTCFAAEREAKYAAVILERAASFGMRPELAGENFNW